MSKVLHVIAFDIPYPPNYGGAIDVFYRISALSEHGIKIILHCFEYNRSKSDVLEKMCYKVFYYKRNTSIISHFSILPYTVISRKNIELISNLTKDNYPIMFEGVMSCYYLNNKLLANRFKIYREANIEHDYYFELFKAGNSIKNKIYYLIESVKFRFYEKELKNSNLILAISKKDQIYYSSKFPSLNVDFIPCFHSNKAVTISCNQSDFILYHGNLSVPENEKSARYLCENVFSKLPYRCIVAGMNPTLLLQNTCDKFSNIELISNPDNEKLSQFVQNAQVHILITFQSTGLKIKLLNTLFEGRHIIVNDKMLVGSGLDSLCHIANTPSEQIELCENLMHLPFNFEDIQKRNTLLIPDFSNEFLAEKISGYLN
ncbi:MAG: glycosyltransferase family 1 protein [Paludibacter sp.]|nr:glycosyltransferase family 1 protein [Paludibacter sp.]